MDRAEIGRISRQLGKSPEWGFEREVGFGFRNAVTLAAVEFTALDYMPILVGWHGSETR